MVGDGGRKSFDVMPAAAQTFHIDFGIFKEGLPPAAALRKAKEKMWRQERWHAPFYWGAFVFQGQYSNQIELPARGRTSRIVVIAGMLILSIVSAHVIVRGFKRRRKAQANVAVGRGGPPF